MKTKLGLLTSKRIAVLYSASTEENKLDKHLDRYSEQDLFETLLMVEYLQLKTRRQDSPSHIWVMRLERLENLLRRRLPEGRLNKWMGKLGFKTAFDAHQHAKSLLFSWLR